MRFLGLFPFCTDGFESGARLAFSVGWAFAQDALLPHLKLAYRALGSFIPPKEEAGSHKESQVGFVCFVFTDGVNNIQTYLNLSLRKLYCDESEKYKFKRVLGTLSSLKHLIFFFNGNIQFWIFPPPTPTLIAMM